MKRRPSGGAGAADRLAQDSGAPGSSRSAPDPQGQFCAACGAPGTLPTIHASQTAGARLTLGTLRGQFRLLCDACRMTLALDRAAARRARP
jgi:hypothetical protein